MSAFSGGAVDRVTTLKELSQQSKLSGIWTNITDEDIDAAAAAPPAIDPMTGMPTGGVPGMPGDPAAAGAPGGGRLALGLWPRARFMHYLGEGRTPRFSITVRAASVGSDY